MRYPLASRTGSGLFWWVIYAQQAWSDLTKPQRAALLAVADGQPARRDVAS